MSLRVCADSSEPSLLSHAECECRRRLWPKFRSLASLEMSAAMIGIVQLMGIYATDGYCVDLCKYPYSILLRVQRFISKKTVLIKVPEGVQQFSWVWGPTFFQDGGPIAYSL